MTIGKRPTKLSSGVKGKAGVSDVPADRANVEDIPGLVGGAILSKELDSLGAGSIAVERGDVKKAYLQRYLHRRPE